MAAKKGRPRNAGDKRGQATKPAPSKPSTGKPGLGNTHSRGPNVGTPGGGPDLSNLAYDAVTGMQGRGALKPGGGVQGIRRPPTQQQPAVSPLSALPESLRGRWDGNYGGGKPQGGTERALPAAQIGKQPDFGSLPPEAQERFRSLGQRGLGDMPISFNQGGQPGGMDFTDFQSQHGGGGGPDLSNLAYDAVTGMQGRGALKPGATTGLWTPQDQGRANAPGAPGSANMLEAFQKPDVGSIGVAPPPGAPPGRVNPVRHGRGNLGRGQGRGPLAPPTAPGPGGTPMGVEPGGVSRGTGGVPPLPPTTAGPGPGGGFRPVPGMRPGPGMGVSPGGVERPAPGVAPGLPTDRGPTFGGMMPPVQGPSPTDRVPPPGGGMSFAPPPEPGMVAPGPGPGGPTRMPPVPGGLPGKGRPGPRLSRLMETGQVDPGIARLAMQ